MIRRTIATAVLLLCTLPLLAATKNDAVLGKVNGDPVTAQDLLLAFSDRHSGHAKFLGGDAEARKFLKIMMDEKLFVQEAYNIGLDQDPEVTRLVDDFRNRKITDALVKTEIDSKATPSAEEVKKIWEDLNFFVQVRQIAVETREEAEEIRAALLHSASFETLARDCSRAESRSHGGHVLVNWGQMEPAWERIVFSLEPGEISPVIETKDGFEVVIADAHVDAIHPAFEKVHEQIESTLRERRTEELRRALSEELQAKYHVVLQPLDRSIPALTRKLRTAPETVIATWDGGGKLLLKDAISESELSALVGFSPVRAAGEIDKKIGATINGPLVLVEAKARKIDEQLEIAEEVGKYRDMAAERLLFRDHVMNAVTVTPEDVRTYYAANQSKFILPEERRVAQILVSTEKAAIDVRAKLAAGADFDEIARKYSRDFVTAGSGGDLGWITPEKVPPAFKKVLTLGKGALSKPIQSPAGWHIIKVLEIKPSRQPALEEVKEKVEERVVEVKRHDAQKFWLEKLRGAATIEINDDAIREFVVANKFQGNAPPQHGPK